MENGKNEKTPGMSHIGDVLENLGRGKATPDQKTEELPPRELTVEEKKERREELRRSLRVASLDNSFEALEPWPGTEKAVAAFKALASGETEWKMLLCYGGVGNGKTHLCEALAIALYKRGIFLRVLTMDMVMGVLKHSMDAGQQTSLGELLDNYSFSDRLIIDDVTGTAWEFDQLEKIIRVRYREHLFTVLATNLDIEYDPKYPSIPIIPERIVSRFRDPEKGRLILNEGDDFRAGRQRRNK